MCWVNGGSRPAKSCWQQVMKNMHKRAGNAACDPQCSAPRPLGQHNLWPSQCTKRGEKPGGAEAQWPGLTGFGGLLLLGSSHLDPSHLTLMAAMTLTHLIDKETESQRHLVTCPGDTGGGLGFLLGWILKSGTLVFCCVVLASSSYSNII